MPKRLLLSLAGLVGVFVVSSCSLTIYDIVGGSGGNLGGSNVISLPESDYGVAKNNISLAEYSLNTGIVATPSEGEVNILVLPIEIKGYDLTSSAKSKTLNDLEAVFNGSPAETGWESLASFYEESSYGKLSFHAEIAPWYSSGMTLDQIEAGNVSSSSAEGVSYLMRRAVSAYKGESGSNLLDFDSDGDGYLDAVWMVYSAPYGTGSDASSIQWAFTFWDYEAKAAPDSPVGFAYSWASYEFLYEGYGTGKVDAHTFIHETGHLLGLNDYYDTGGSTSPTGYIDMMDANVIDHCAYSKFSLGWISPYVIDKEGSITIGNLATTGEAILVPTNDGYNGSSFDEYLLIELYAPTGLNEQDSKRPYPGNGFQGFSSPGIRAYHVDARLRRVIEEGGELYLYDYVDEIPPTGCYLGASNSVSNQSEAETAYRQISLIAPGDVGVSFETEDVCATLAKKSDGTLVSGVSDCLFKAGDWLDYQDDGIKEQFPNGRAKKSKISNDGTGFAFSFQVSEVASDGSEATIAFVRT